MTKEDILTHATLCFAKEGFDGTSIATILSAAKATKGQLYHHFESKEDLFVECVFNTHRQDAFTNLISLVDVKSKSAYKKKMTDFGLQIITQNEKHPHLAQLAIESAKVVSKNLSIAKKLKQKGDEQKSPIIKAIQNGKDIGAFNKKYELEYIIFRIKSTLDTIVLHTAMKTCMFNYTKMWKLTVEELFQ